MVADNAFVCALSSSGTAQCSGREQRQLDDDELGHSGPNAYSFCAPLTNGTIDCRGENDVGLLGNGTQMNAFVPTPVMLR